MHTLSFYTYVSFYYYFGDGPKPELRVG